VSFWQQVFPHCAGLMFWWMAKNSMRNDTYHSSAAGFLNSAVQMKLTWRRLSRIFPSNSTFQTSIHWSPASVEDDLYSKVAQITNEDTFIFGSDHNLYHWGILRFWIQHSGRNTKSWKSDASDCQKSRDSTPECGFLTIDSGATSHQIRYVRHCMHICEVVYRDTLKGLTA